MASLPLALLSVLLLPGLEAPPALPGAPVIPVSHVPKPCESVELPAHGGTYFMMYAEQMWPAYHVVVQGVHYDIGVQQRRVRYVGTSDGAFRTLEGLSVASTLADVQRYTSDTLRKEIGGDYFAPLP